MVLFVVALSQASGLENVGIVHPYPRLRPLLPEWRKATSTNTALTSTLSAFVCVLVDWELEDEVLDNDKYNSGILLLLTSQIQRLKTVIKSVSGPLVGSALNGINQNRASRQ